MKQARLQTHRNQYESLKMKEDEDVVAYSLRVDKLVNTIRGLCEIIDELVIVQKLLRSLSLQFDAKVSSLEEKKDLDNLTMDELHGILNPYEMRKLK